MKKKKGRPRKSERKYLEEEIEDLIISILRLINGNVCQICGKERGDCGTFHVLSKGSLSNIKYRSENLLWAGWFCCHYKWHHDFYHARDKIVPRLTELLGEGYEDRLKQLSNSLPDKITVPDFQELKEKLTVKLTKLKEEKFGIQ